MSQINQEHWQDEDFEIEQEFADIVPICREAKQPELLVPKKLDQKITKLAGLSAIDQLLDSWILGSGPRVILVTIIFFAIALAFSLFF